MERVIIKLLPVIAIIRFGRIVRDGKRPQVDVISDRFCEIADPVGAEKRNGRKKPVQNGFKKFSRAGVFKYFFRLGSDNG